MKISKRYIWWIRRPRQRSIIETEVSSMRGRFWYGKMHGKGKMYSKEGQLLFDAEFIDDKLDGIGAMYLSDGKQVVGN